MTDEEIIEEIRVQLIRSDEGCIRSPCEPGKTCVCEEAARARIREQCAEEAETAAEVRRLLQDNHARQLGSHSVAACEEGYAALALEEFSFALRKPKANPND